MVPSHPLRFFKGLEVVSTKPLKVRLLARDLGAAQFCWLFFEGKQEEPEHFGGSLHFEANFSVKVKGTSSPCVFCLFNLAHLGLSFGCTLPQTNMEAVPIGLCKWNQVFVQRGGSLHVGGRGGLVTLRPVLGCRAAPNPDSHWPCWAVEAASHEDMGNRVWGKIEPPGTGPHVVVFGSRYQGSMFGTHF